jgi:signal transduction histidine kinase
MSLPGADHAWLDRLAHDLRGPLAPLQTATYLLQRDDIDEDRRKELLAMLERQVRRLGAMLEELGDWVRVGRGKLLGKTEPCEPVMLLDHALVGAGLAGTPVDDDGTIAVVDGDPQRLTQLLRTLLDFARARGATPMVSLRTGGARIAVRIALPGVRVEAPGELVESQEGDPFDEGLGLRLLLAREIARAHGGDLSAGNDGDALVFLCELPLSGEAGDQG